MDPSGQENPFKIALFGNPNVGKSVIFGFLTGRYVSVSNYPGTTVEISYGHTTVDGRRIDVMDTPGINSLVPMSEDERVSRDILLTEKIDAVVQVADAKNIRRTLLLSLQLAEMGIPLLLDLNMEDELEGRGVSIDKERLAALLGVPVLGTVAIRKKGLRELKKRMLSPGAPRLSLTYSAPIEEAAREIEQLLPSSPISRRSIALMILSGDQTLAAWLHEHLSPEAVAAAESIRRTLAERFSEPVAYVINKQRLSKAEAILREVAENNPRPGRGWAERLGRLSMHPVWGLFVMAAVLFALYEFVGRFGAQTAVGWLEKDLFGNIVNPFAERFFSKILSFSPLLRDLIVGPYGLITMALTYALAIILPIVTTFFLFFSLLEDSGYLPRLAVMLNRIFRFMGLNGKAVVPMVLGLGCDTMATMAARIMETKKERVILTLLLALGVPCSAQLGIILGMLGSLPGWASLVWMGVVGGSLVMVGFLSSKILPGQRSDFLVEVPPIRVPTLINIVTKTVARLEWYLKEVVPLFILGTFFLFVLDKSGALPRIQELANPLVVRILGLPPEATEAFLIGFLRRDYGATHFFDMYNHGRLDVTQTLVSLIVITLFVPCLANMLMIVKERGAKAAAAIVSFIYPFAFLAGGVVNWVVRKSL